MFWSFERAVGTIWGNSGSFPRRDGTMQPMIKETDSIWDGGKDSYLWF